MIDKLLKLLAVLVLASLNYKLGQLVRAQQSIAQSHRMMLGNSIDVLTVEARTRTARPYSERN